MNEQYFCYGCNSLVSESPLRDTNDVKCVKCMSPCIEIIESNEQMEEIMEGSQNTSESVNIRPTDEASSVPTTRTVSTISTGRPTWLSSLGSMRSMLPGILPFAQMLSMANMPGATVNTTASETPPVANNTATAATTRTSSGSRSTVPEGGSVTITVRIKNSDGSEYESMEAAAADSVGQALVDGVSDTIRSICNANRGHVVVERRRGVDSSPARENTRAGDRRAQRSNNFHTDPIDNAMLPPLFLQNSFPFQRSPLLTSVRPVVSERSPFRFRQRRRTESDGTSSNPALPSQFNNLFQILLDMGNDRELNSERRNRRSEDSNTRVVSVDGSSTGSLYSDDGSENDSYVLFRGGDDNNMTRFQFMVRRGFENTEEGMGESINDFLHRLFQSHEAPTNPTPSHVIHGLPTIAGGVTSAMKEANEMYALPCSVCQDDFDEQSEPVVQLACGHVYHRDCIVPWLERSQQCPTCRANVITGQSPR